MPNIAPQGLGAPAQPKTDAQLLEMHTRYKKESFDMRWVFERQWVRNLYYILGRHWIYYDSKRGEWRDKRLAKWIPRPVTNMMRTSQEAISAMFTSIRLGADARPNGNDPKNIIAAAAADNYAPILHAEHRMNTVLSDFDFWLIVTGNAFLHTYLDHDLRFGMVQDPVEHCADCNEVGTTSSFTQSGNACPSCGSQNIQPVIDPATGQQAIQRLPEQRGQTCALSPLEIAFPLHYTQWNDVPYIYRLRWRDKFWYENHQDDAVRALVGQIAWQKAPMERTMQIFKSLPLQNDLGVGNSYSMGGNSTESEGVSEYDLYIKPCADFPDGYVCRFIGDSNPIIMHSESEALPGPLPYHDAEGNPLWTFTHGCYSKVGGRILGAGALDTAIGKQNDLNQLDSMIQMIILRMSNPIWLEPKGAEVEKFTGEPGLVVKWNPLTVQGGAKPERIPGENVPPSLFNIREQYVHDIEELTGTFDVLKGAKPSGVEAFSALQLLVERGQSRFASAFQARGDAYTDWMKFALEIEREFGPEDRTRAVLGPAKGWMFETFKRTQLEGSVSIIVEDGTNTPKTALGRRAAMEHATQLGALNLEEPDQKYAALSVLGLTEFAPALDIQVQAALKNQDQFEQWANDPAAIQASAQTGMSPLKWKRWYDPIIHRGEFLKWANSDGVQRLLVEKPQLEGLMDAYLIELDLAIMAKAAGAIDVGKELLLPPGEGGVPGGPGGPMGAGAPKGQTPGKTPPGQPVGNQPGAAQAMSNSNSNSAPAGNMGQPEPGMATAG